MAAKATRGSISSGIFVIITLISASLLCIVAKDLEFHHYHFRKKSNWGRAVKRADYLCREETCKSVEDGLQKDICVRKCISPHCYEELYAWNELEEGERDIRWTSFKGCAADELRRKQQEKFGV